MNAPFYYTEKYRKKNKWSDNGSIMQLIYAGFRDARTAWLGSYIGSDGDTYVNIFENFQNLTLLVRRLHRKSTSLFRFEEHSETGADNDSRASTGFVKNCLNPENKILKSTKF